MTQRTTSARCGFGAMAGHADEGATGGMGPGSLAGFVDLDLDEAFRK
jgi:hypothetical protein